MEKFETILNKIAKKIESSNPFKSGDPEGSFNQEVEFQKLKELHGEEGLKKVEEFKEKLRFQKEGLAAIQSKIWPYIKMTHNVSVEAMQDLIKDDLEKYNFNRRILKDIKHSLENINKRAQLIKEACADCYDENGKLDKKKLFQKLFYRLPEGDLKLEVNNLAIDFILENPKDFAYIGSSNYKKRKNVVKDDVKKVSGAAGYNLSDYSNVKLGLRGALLIEDPDSFKDQKTHKAFKDHEEMHAFNSLFLNAYIDNKKFYNIDNSDKQFGVKKYKDLIKNNLGNLDRWEKRKMKNILIEVNPAIESNIKDEIVSYFKQGISSKETSLNLLRKDTAYDYGFGYGKHLYDSPDKKLRKEYLGMVVNGIIAFRMLLDQGYSYNAVHAVLFNEPLASWLKVAQRFGGVNLTHKEFKKLERKFISPEILLDIKTKQEAEKKRNI
jgi:hypothetical protein